ncbi:hypothetical protein PTKIN_Ptkin11bG0143400 [Pterospermum kingtungense]
MALRLPSLSGLSSLTRLNLSYCNLWEGAIPNDICCLSSLKTLDLSGNNFMSLPGTISCLSKLRLLQLSDCKRLKALPALLTSIEALILDGCASLEVFANPSTVCNSSIYYPLIFSPIFYRELMNNNALTTMKKLKALYANRKSTFDVIIPGNEIPKRLSYQTDESSIKIALPRNDSQWVAVVLCFVFVSAFNDDNDACAEEAIEYKAVTRHSKNSRHAEFHGFLSRRPFTRQRITKDHLWLHYFSRENALKDTYWENEECTEIELVIGLVSAKVRKCGVRILNEKDLEELQQIIKQLSNSVSATNSDDISQDTSTAHGSIGVNASFVKRKRNTICDEEEVGPLPKRRKKYLNFMMWKKH